MNNLLYRAITSDNGPKLVLCLPKTAIADILRAYHDDPIGGHLGRNKTFKKVAERYHFNHMNKIISHYVKTCPDFQTKNNPATLKAGQMVLIGTKGPFEMVGIDLMGPFKSTVEGNKWIILATDYFTKYVETKALKNL